MMRRVETCRRSWTRLTLSVMEKYPGSFQHHSGRNRGRHRKGKILASTHDKVVHIFAYLSSKAYETMRDSGCIHLPSSRTLRDYNILIASR